MIKEKKIIIIDDYILLPDLANEYPLLIRPFSGDKNNKQYIINSEYELRGEYFIITDLHNSLIGLNYTHYFLLCASTNKDVNFNIYVNKQNCTDNQTINGHHSMLNPYNMKLSNVVFGIYKEIEMTGTARNLLTSFKVDKKTLIVPL